MISRAIARSIYQVIVLIQSHESKKDKKGKTEILSFLGQLAFPKLAL